MGAAILKPTATAQGKTKDEAIANVRPKLNAVTLDAAKNAAAKANERQKKYDAATFHGQKPRKDVKID